MITVRKSNDGLPIPAVKAKSPANKELSQDIFSDFPILLCPSVTDTMKKCIQLREVNDPNRECASELPELSSHKVIVAKDGKQGLNLFSKRIKILFLTDTMMPDIGGYEFSEVQRKDHHPVPWLFIFRKERP